MVHLLASRYTGRQRVGTGSGGKRHSWCDWESGIGYIKQISKLIEQIGTYIEDNESQVGEGSYIYGEEESYNGP